jgi:arsenite methyltransferase
MDCCNPDNANPASTADTRDAVRVTYATIAQEGSLNVVTGGGCCGPAATAPLDHDFLAHQLGYDAEHLQQLPRGANMGLSCGNPTAIANLLPGQTVVDLGSGGGFDCFLAGPKVGTTGRVIGIDMTPEMLSKARQNSVSYRAGTGLDNVEFRLGEIEHLPLPDNQADVVISNCVINLSPDKAQVWREIARVLKPGGRAVVSDIALLQPLPDAVKAMPSAMIGCVAGAVLVSEYQALIQAAGLTDLEVTPKSEYVATLVANGDPMYAEIARHLPAGQRCGDVITSLDVVARKP